MTVSQNSQPKGLIRLNEVDRVRALVDSFWAGKAESTRRVYNNDLLQFAKYLGVTGIDDVAQNLLDQESGAAHFLVLQYKQSMVDEGFSPRTVNRRLSAVRALIRIARMLGMINWSLEISGLPTRRYKDTSGPGLANFNRMLSFLDLSTTKGKRDHAILRLLFDLALRRGEVERLDYPDDLDLPQRVIWVWGKGRAEKEKMNLPEVTRDALQGWIDARGDREGPLFVNLDRAYKGERLTGRSIDRNVLKPLAKKVGVKASPHGLRHTAITQAVKAARINDIGLEEVRDFSRHSSVQTLILYRDRERNVQGKLARLVSEGATGDE